MYNHNLDIEILLLQKSPMDACLFFKKREYR